MLREVSIEKIHPNPFNVRSKENDGFQPESIKLLAAGMSSPEVGFWNAPLKARKRPDGEYEIAFGNRRLAACRRNKRAKLVLDVEPLDDAHMTLLSAVENFQRVDLDNEEKLAAWGAVRELFDKKPVTAARVLGLDEVTLRAYEQEWTRRERKREQAEADLKDDPAEKPKSSKSKGKSGSRARDTSKSSKSKGKSESPPRISPACSAIARQLGNKLVTLRADGQDYAEAMVDAVEELEIGARQLEAIRTEIVASGKSALHGSGSILQIHLLDALLAGKIHSAKDVEVNAKRFEKKLFQEWTKKNKVPPDLIQVVKKWIKLLGDFVPQLEEIAKSKEYADYVVEGDPKLAEQFRQWLVRNETASGKIAKYILPRLS